MTPRADALIGPLKLRLVTNPLDLNTVVYVMLAQGHRPSEIGWVVHHVFNLSMPEAVHIATVLDDPSRGGG